MKVLVCTTPGSFAYEERELPAITPGHTLLKIRKIGICGTDLHAFEGTQPYFNYPRILGHELAAEIVDTQAEGFSKGDKVTIIPYFSCEVCVACRMRKPNCCATIRVCGVHVDGGMAEYLLAPDETLLAGNDMSFEQLALVEPLAIGAHGVRRAGIVSGEFVLVVGAGPIGLGTMEFARIAGGRVIAMDINPHRLNFCREQLGVEFTVDASAADVMEQLQTITGGDMPTVVVDATGNGRAINNAFRYLGHGGRYVLVGLQKGDITFSHPEFHKRESTLMSSRNATREDFEHVMSSMRLQLVKPDHYITHRVAFDEVKEQFPNWLDPAHGVIKAMVDM